MAIRVLLDHGVQQDHIVFVTFLVARDGGISILRHTFPDVKIICAAIDDHMREGYEVDGNPESEERKIWAMHPGMGQMGELFNPITCNIFMDALAPGNRYYL
jgi:uridine kinase